MKYEDKKKSPNSFKEVLQNNKATFRDMFIYAI